jgi:transposase InsO family protein
MCRVLQITRSAFYSWQGRSGTRLARRREQEELLIRIRLAHQKSRETYGSPRVYKALRDDGVVVNHKRVETLMSEQGLHGKVRRRFHATTDSKHQLPRAPNTLNQQFSAEFSDQVWMSDITVIPTRSGSMYLAVVIDLYSRMVVGWALEPHLRTELVEKALKHALGSRIPRRGMLHHSDQGSQYASASYRRILELHGIQASMSRAGNCYDNAVVESFNGTLKQELVRGTSWRSLAEARAALHEYIEVFYNRQRLHSSLGYLSPASYEARKCAG